MADLTTDERLAILAAAGCDPEVAEIVAATLAAYRERGERE